MITFAPFLAVASVALIAGLVGYFVGLFVAGKRISILMNDLVRAHADLDNQENAIKDLRLTAERSATEAQRLSEEGMQAAIRAARVESELEAAHRILTNDEERMRTLKAQMANSFNELAAAALKERQAIFDRDAQQKGESIDALLQPLGERLGRLDQALIALGTARETGQATLSEQLRQLIDAQRELTTKTQALETATAALSTALANPRVRGNWGEQTLDNVIEIAGMSDFCDVLDQETLSDQEAQGRPDKLIRVPHSNGQRVVVDAKAPGDFFKAACEATAESERKTALAAHAKATMAHVDELAVRNYSRYAEQQRHMERPWDHTSVICSRRLSVSPNSAPAMIGRRLRWKI